MAQRQARFFINRADANGVLLRAIAATPEIALVPSAIFVSHFIHVRAFAMRTARRIAPALRLEKLNREQFIAAHLRHTLDDFRLRQFGTLIQLGQLLIH